jgi:hypothetical protein
MRDARRAVDQFEVLHRMISRDPASRAGAVERARASLVDLDGGYPVDEIAAELVDCLIRHRLP